MFIDEVTIKLIAGKGGDGCSSFRHEKYIEMGGPDGGNGGHGGNIIFEAEKGLKTLIDLRYKKLLKAERGCHGKGKNMTGASAEDLVVRVPVGTTIKDVETNLVICDLTEDKQRCVVAKGGRGGKGNAAFKSNRNKAPLTSEYGEPGEEKTVFCELKLLADVGLVGFPSVGKSSLINLISAAKAKVAAYHFTTLTPNLGVVKTSDGYAYTVADLPGLIEGASEGVGLGDRFLKHALRTKVIAHVIDMASTEGRDVIEDYETIENELKKYSEVLANKKHIIIANKMDIEGSKENLRVFKEKYKDEVIIETSAVTKEGINDLIYSLANIVKEVETSPIYEQNELESYVLYEFKEEKPYEIKREGNTWVVTGEKLEKLLKMTKFNSDEASLKFARKLKSLGVDEELRRLGAEEGDTVRILDFDFEYEERLNY